jgi:hypothetical protein
MKRLLTAASIALQGCALAVTGGGEPVPQSFSMNGVKRISPSVARGDDPSSYLQDSYPVAPDSRLLFRFEELSTRDLSRIRVSAPDKVEVQVAAVSAAEAAVAKDRLELCPVTRNWMMLATWSSAHPFGGADGEWARPGGDHDAAGCVKAHKTEDQRLLFDVTTWFVDYPRGRGLNYGLLLRSESAAVSVVGERSGSYSPRILWKE